ncbi:conserved hypothetical protein, partial [Wolbachia endosymbiont of Drosophila ananassae]
ANSSIAIAQCDINGNFVKKKYGTNKACRVR